MAKLNTNKNNKVTNVSVDCSITFTGKISSQALLVYLDNYNAMNSTQIPKNSLPDDCTKAIQVMIDEYGLHQVVSVLESSEGCSWDLNVEVT